MRSIPLLFKSFWAALIFLIDYWIRLFYIRHDVYNDYLRRHFMRQVNLAKAKSSLSEFAGRAAYTREHIIITKRGKPFAAIISIEDLELLEKVQAGSPEDGLLGAVGMAPEFEEVAEKAMEAYNRRTGDFGRKLNI